MELVAFLGEDQETLGQVQALIKKGSWEKVIIVKSKNSPDFEGGSETLVFNTAQPITELKEELTNKLRSKLSGDFEVALSIASGTGKEHMALISALLSIPVGIKFAVFTKKGVELID